MAKRTLPRSIQAWEKETGFEATNARRAIAEGTSLRDGLSADLEWFIAWYTECLIHGESALEKIR
ncbi:MAG: hypothetical protein V4719_26535 [Planctomycetota bacterium]